MNGEMNPSNRSLFYRTIPEPSPEKQQLLEDAHLHEQHRNSPDAANYRRRLLQSWVAFAASQPTPWNASIMRGIFESSLDNQDEALQADLQSLNEATSPEERAISHNNLSHDYRRLGAAEQALAHSEKACALWASHFGFLQNLRAAHELAGNTEKAQAIQRFLEDNADPSDPTDLVVAHALLED